MITLYHQESRAGRVTLEMDPEGKHLFTVSGHRPDDPGMTIVLDGEETALYRTWGGRFLDILAGQVRAEPERFASRNLLPPFEPREGEWDWKAEAEAEERRKALPPRAAAFASLFAAVALAVLVGYVVDPVAGEGKELYGTAVFRHAAPVEDQERAFLVVALYGGEEVSVPVPLDHALRPGGRVVVREFRSRLFGKRTFRFVRYL
jgi:hypothetical protein